MEAGVETGSTTKPLGTVVQIDEGKIWAHLDEVVRATVVETLNALLDAEADHLCGARKYERSEGRKDTRAGSYERQLHTKAGEVSLQVPKLRSLLFKTAIIERYRRQETSVEKALIEMYLAGVSVRRVEDITQALWGARGSASTVSDLNRKRECAKDPGHYRFALTSSYAAGLGGGQLPEMGPMARGCAIAE